MECDKRNSDISFLLKKINDSMQRNFNQQLKTMDLTMSQMHILRFLRINRNRVVTQKEIEDYLEVSHPTVVGLLKRLEAKKFITTELRTDGRMVKTVKLTEKENELNQVLIQNHIQVEKLLLNGMNEEEICRLREDLQHIFHNIQEEQNDSNTGKTNKTV